jgi:ankyrin repeat protein
VQLLSQDERVNPSVQDNFLICDACEAGRVEIVQLLLQDKRVDPSVRNNQAIREASGKGHHEVVQLLLEDERVDPSAEDSQAICLASGKRHHEIVKLLLEDARVDPSTQNNQVIRDMSASGCAELVKMLLKDERVNPSVKDNEAIRVASGRGGYDVVKLLLQDKRVDPSAHGNQAFRQASLSISKLLLTDKRVDPSVDRQRIVCRVLYWGDNTMLRGLLTDDRIVATIQELNHLNNSYNWTNNPEGCTLLATWPRVWPKFIGCDPPKWQPNSQLKERFKLLEAESSWKLLLCVKRRFTPRVAARVGDVLREVCSEWTRYQTEGDRKRGGT